MELAFAPVADSLAAANSVTSPGAGATIASLAAPPAGKYLIDVTVFLSGTAETALKNLRLLYNGATKVDTIPSISAGGVLTFRVPYASLDGTNPVTLIAIGAGVVGAVYNAVIVATRLA